MPVATVKNRFADRINENGQAIEIGAHVGKDDLGNLISSGAFFRADICGIRSFLFFFVEEEKENQVFCKNPVKQKMIRESLL